MKTLAGSTDVLRLLSDSNRLRLLALLEREPLTVAELTQITRLSQSRVSTHLGKLRDAGLLRDRRAGTSVYYRLSDRLPEDAAEVWRWVSGHTEDPLFDTDAVRAKEVVGARAGATTWADTVAGRMERHYSPGRTWESLTRGLLGFVSAGDVLDVASGDCAVAELLAPRAQSVTCLDKSERVLSAGRARLAHLDSMRFARGDMHALPFYDARFSNVLLLNCLTYADRPAQVVAEAARVSIPGATIVAVTLKRHRHKERVAAFNHTRLGFHRKELHGLFEAAGLLVDLCDVTSRERRAPQFEVLTVHARKPEAVR
ncbi:MAG: metalloregulator ArsR/SmtB family transcription factor [Planctomycetota bacterium]